MIRYENKALNVCAKACDNRNPDTCKPVWHEVGWWHAFPHIPMYQLYKLNSGHCQSWMTDEIYC